jgi:GNAT superfamily N-acetyltransferase
MYVERQASALSYGADDDRSNREIRDESSVHDIDMDPVGTGSLGRGDLFPQAPEIRRKDGGGDEDPVNRSAHGGGVSFAPASVKPHVNGRAMRAASDTVSRFLREPCKGTTLDKTMTPRPMTKADFDEIVEVIDRWWGGPIGTFAHPIFFYELGEHARVIEDRGEMIGFLLGFITHESVRTGYVHLVGIHPEYRRRGVGRMLYAAFVETCRAAGSQRIKAITTLGNEGSKAFHLALGWDAREVDDYAGPGRRRIVFTKDLGTA